MNFVEGEFYMHKQSMDVCVRVLKIMGQTEDTAQLIIENWNLGYAGRPWKINDETFALNIGRGYKLDWKRISVWQMIRPRETAGLPIGVKL